MEEKNKELCQLEIFPPNAILEDLCINQQSEEFPSSCGETLRKETYEVERKEKNEMSDENELCEKSEENRKHLVRENK